MGNERQMKRGKAQALYKYLPETWIDFPVRGRERMQYIAKVERWNGVKLDGVNNKRLLRMVDDAVRSFASQSANTNPRISPVVGFSPELTEETCDVLTPAVSEESSSITARISPLTFYCKDCYRVYQFDSEAEYRSHCRCGNGHAALSQFRQIYFCKCGYATDRHDINCPEHGSRYMKWNGKYDFFCTKPGCGRRTTMRRRCPVCGSNLGPKVALDPAQFFAFNLNMIDLVDGELERFIAGSEDGAFLAAAYWLNWIGREELDRLIHSGTAQDPQAYQQAYDAQYALFLNSFKNEALAAQMAKTAADQLCGNPYSTMIGKLKGRLTTGAGSLSALAERILEYDMVIHLEDVSTLADAMEAAYTLNTVANPGEYADIARRYGISDVRVCDRIPFVSCSYGYTRGQPGPGDGVQLHALKEQTLGRNSIYATRLDTEGVLFEFDRKRILTWLLANGMIDAETAPDLESEEEVKLWFLDNIRPELIQPFNPVDQRTSPATYYVYRLIHSLSHLLIRAAADIGGLGKDSMSEYIFPGIPAVLIYCQNSQGFSLGSLRNTFEAHFDYWMNRAYEAARKCVFDPVCIERHKACTGCLYLNEVSCQHFNKDLDRALVIGHLDRETQVKTIGFWEE